VLEASQILRYYREVFQEQGWHQRWKGLWRKQYKLRLSDGRFLALNKLRPQLTFNSLKKYLIQFAPINVYQSVLNWLPPSHLSYKNKSHPALPLPS
jgi:hypothetical protein